MSSDKISFPAPEKSKPILPAFPKDSMEFARLTLDFGTSKPQFLFESTNEQETDVFEDTLSLLNYFGSKGWGFAFKEQNDTLYLQRNSSKI